MRYNTPPNISTTPATHQEAVLERTFVFIKPDGVQRGLAGEIITRFERRGLRLVGMKLIHASKELVEEHYGEHVGKSFFEPTVNYVTSGPVVAMVWEGKEGTIDMVRNTIGATSPAKADPGTIRGDLGIEVGRNLVHGSDSPESAAREINLWWDESEIVSWARDTDRWIFE